MKILCYGDSNTWGYVPNIDGYSKMAKAMQYRERDCWWFALRKNNELFVDGLCGRCIAHENRWNEGRNAMQTIEDDLRKYDGMDLIIVFLGTNDCKSEYADTPEKIAQNLENLLQIIKSKTNAKIAIISPPIIREGNKITDKFYVGAQKKSEKLTDYYKDLASKNGYYFVSGADLEIGEDGEHLTRNGHKQLFDKVVDSFILGKKMKEKKQKRVIYYSDELNDDFAGTNIKKQRKVGKKFHYVHYGLLWNIFASVIYWGVAFWIFWIYQVVFKRVKIVNKKAIKKTKAGRFFYGNHTSIDDAYKPGLIVAPRQNRILASPDAVSIKGLTTLVQMVGVIPVPNEITGMKKFVKAIKHYNKWKYDIFIYPEAHIWPYYTGVRPFVDGSFYYPVLLNKPVYAFFTAYTEPKGLFAKYRKANATIYISEPFFPDQTKPRKEAQKELRNKVYDFMKECSEKYSTYKAIEYVKVEK